MKQFCLASLAVTSMMAAGCIKQKTTPKTDTAGTSARAETVSTGETRPYGCNVKY